MASNLELAINNSTIKNDQIIAKLDSGATKRFFKKEHIQLLKNIKILQELFANIFNNVELSEKIGA